MNMKKTLGYGYRLSSESLSKVLTSYYDEISLLSKSIIDVKNQINLNIKNGTISKKSKPKIFKIVIEE